MKKLLYSFIMLLFASSMALFAAKPVDSAKLTKADSALSQSYAMLSPNQIFELERAKIEAFRPDLDRVIPSFHAVFVFPFATIFLLVLLFLLFRYLNNKKKYMLYAKYIENGKDIPIELLNPVKERASNLKKGILILFLGFGFMLTMIVTHFRGWSLGFIIIFVGIGYLLVHWLENKPKQTNEPN